MIGIDVGTCSVKLVETEAESPQRIRVRAVTEVAAAPGEMADGSLVNPQALGGAIRQALRKAGMTADRAAVAVPAQFGFIRRVSFPPMPLKELRAAVDLQPERYIPLGRESSVYDLHVLPGAEADGQISVVLAAAPRQTVLDLMALCRAAGLKPVRIDLEPLALYRALVGAGLTSTQADTAIVDLGASGAKISLLAGPVPVISRVVDTPRQVQGALAGTDTEDLFVDIRRSLEFVLTQTGARPSRVFVAGGGGDDIYLLLALTGYLRSSLGGRLPADFQVAPVAAPDVGVAQSHMLAFGLSLHPELFA